MRRKWVILCLTLAAVVGTLVGVRQMVAKDEAGKTDEPKKMLDEMTSKLKAEDYKGLFAYANEVNSRTAPNAEGANSLPDPIIASTMFIKQMEKDSPGKFTGEVELTSKEVLGSHFVRYQLVQWHEFGGNVWKIGFFRTSRGWMLQELSWDGKILNYLKPVAP